MNKISKIYFDLDGTIAGLYDIPTWLNDIKAEYTKPFREARSLVNMHEFGKILNLLQQRGYIVGIISCTPKYSSDDYNQRVALTKRNWLEKHLGAVNFDEIHIIDYYMPKHSIGSCENAILFDDEQRHRDAWTGKAYDEKHIFEVLNALLD